MELLLAAGIPSAITAFCFWIIEKKIQERTAQEQQERTKRQEELDKKEKNREQLKAIDGSLALSEAIAKAVQRIPDAKCNGDMHSALDYEKNAKHDLENFLNMQAVDHITGGAR